MTETKNSFVDKTIILEQIADLSKLLGMIPSDDTVTVNEPVTHNSMELSEWLSKTRDSFLELSILLEKAFSVS